jgi:hypothetical protein
MQFSLSLGISNETFQLLNRPYLWVPKDWLSNVNIWNELPELFDEVDHVDSGIRHISGAGFNVQVNAVTLVERRPL